MLRLGHSTPTTPMRDDDATRDRDKAIAEAMSGFYPAQVVELRSAGGARSSGNSVAATLNATLGDPLTLAHIFARRRQRRVQLG